MRPRGAALSGRKIRAIFLPMIRPAASLLTLFLAAACATPQEKCRSDATRDLRVVNGLIAESRATLKRGYAFETETTVVPRFVFCAGYRDGGRIAVGGRFCHVNQVVQRKTPVAVDLAEERKKLNSLIRKRSQLKAETERRLQLCARL